MLKNNFVSHIFNKEFLPSADYPKLHKKEIKKIPES